MLAALHRVEKYTLLLVPYTHSHSLTFFDRCSPHCLQLSISVSISIFSSLSLTSRIGSIYSLENRTGPIIPNRWFSISILGTIYLDHAQTRYRPRRLGFRIAKGRGPFGFSQCGRLRFAGFFGEVVRCRHVRRAPHDGIVSYFIFIYIILK